MRKDSEILREAGRRLLAREAQSSRRFICCEIITIVAENSGTVNFIAGTYESVQQLRQRVMESIDNHPIYELFLIAQTGRHSVYSDKAIPFIRFLRHKRCLHLAEQLEAEGR